VLNYDRKADEEIKRGMKRERRYACYKRSGNSKTRTGSSFIGAVS